MRCPDCGDPRARHSDQRDMHLWCPTCRQEQPCPCLACDATCPTCPLLAAVAFPVCCLTCGAVLP